MRSGLVAALATLAAVVAGEAAPLEPLRLELNALETAEGRCRASFVIENKGDTAFESLRLELALFNRTGIVQRRLATEMGRFGDIGDWAAKAGDESARLIAVLLARVDRIQAGIVEEL